MQKTTTYKQLIYSSAAALYFVILVLRNIMTFPAIELAWNAVIIACFFLGVLKYRLVISKEELVLFAIMTISSFTNYLVVGNTSIAECIFLLLFIGIYRLLIDENIKEIFLEMAVYAIGLLILLTILRRGVGNPIFINLSNNFVSVVLLMPLTVYYVRSEQKKMPLKLFPAFVAFFVSLLALGRGGILSTSLLLGGLLLFASSQRSNISSKYRFLIQSAIILGTIGLFVIVGFFWSKVQSISVLERFITHGMYGTGRIGIWSEYIDMMMEKPNNMIFGVKFSDLVLMVRYKNNLHNSFFNVHALYGIVALLYIVHLIISDYIKGIKTGRWVYLVTMSAFIFRSLTDKIFGGGAIATPVMFFLLLYIRRSEVKKKYQNNVTRHYNY